MVIGNRCSTPPDTRWASSSTGSSAGVRTRRTRRRWCFFGDGATSQGDVHEAMVYAAAYNAPVVFFCQNNQWAISEPIEKQTRVPLFHRARGLRVPRSPGGRQRRARLPRRDAGGAGGVPHRQRTGPDRGVHVPDGRAHHVRRPDPLPAGRRDRALEAARPDRAGQGSPGPQRPGRPRLLRRCRCRGRRARRAVPRPPASRCRSRRRSRCSTTSMPRPTRWWTASGPSSWSTSPVRRGPRVRRTGGRARRGH